MHEATRKVATVAKRGVLFSNIEREKEIYFGVLTARRAVPTAVTMLKAEFLLQQRKEQSCCCIWLARLVVAAARDATKANGSN